MLRLVGEGPVAVEVQRCYAALRISMSWSPPLRRVTTQVQRCYAALRISIMTLILLKSVLMKVQRCDAALRISTPRPRAEDFNSHAVGVPREPQDSAAPSARC